MDGVFAMMVDITVNSSNCMITGWGIFNDGRYYSSNCVIYGWRVCNDGRYNSQQQ